MQEFSGLEGFAIARFDRHNRFSINIWSHQVNCPIIISNLWGHMSDLAMDF